MKITEKEWLNLCQSVKNEKCDCIHWDDAPVTSFRTNTASGVNAAICVLVRIRSDGTNLIAGTDISNILQTSRANLMQICFLSMFLISFYECIIPWIGQKWN